MATISDVAKHAGVSTATVSRVLNGKGYISDQTRAKVEYAIRELDYQYNKLARSLATNRTHLVALLLNDITNPFFPLMVRGVEETADKNDYNVILCNLADSAEREIAYVNDLLRRQVDGLIFVGSQLGEDVYGSKINLSVPVVRLDRQVFVPGCDSVLIDQKKGAYDMTRYLIELGHERIAHISGPRIFLTAVDRIAGFTSAMSDMGLRIRKQDIVESDYSIEGGKLAMERIMQLERRPTAVFAANDLMAIGAMDRLRKAGMQVPSDMAIAGFDDISFSELTVPPLTTVAQPTYHLGSMAMQILADRLAGKMSKESQRIMLQPAIIVRESTTTRQERSS